MGILHPAREGELDRHRRARGAELTIIGLGDEWEVSGSPVRNVGKTFVSIALALPFCVPTFRHPTLPLLGKFLQCKEVAILREIFVIGTKTLYRHYFALLRRTSGLLHCRAGGRVNETAPNNQTKVCQARDIAERLSLGRITVT